LIAQVRGGNLAVQSHKGVEIMADIYGAPIWALLCFAFFSVVNRGYALNIMQGWAGVFIYSTWPKS